jgi:hypothetical protein
MNVVRKQAPALVLCFLGRSPMAKKLEVAHETQNHDETIEASNTPSEQIQHGAPSGPRQKRRDGYDGREPLPYPGHEAVAQFRAAPPSLRKFESLTALATHFKVTRMTVHRWRQDIDVMQRTYWLSMRNKVAGDLLARQAWVRIMKKVIEMAKKGDFRAIKFIESRAWAEELGVQQSQLSASICVADLFGTDVSDEEEGQDDNQQSEEDNR